MTVLVPGSQSSKKLRVQTIDEKGKVCKHKADFVARCSVRKGEKLASDKRFQQQADMYTAMHFLWVETENDENNFTKFGPILMAGLINNFVQQGKAIVTKESDKRILFVLESAKYFIELCDEIESELPFELLCY